MLPKINRLKKKKDFEIVFKKGKSSKEGFLLLRVAKNNLKMSRFGFIVSKKISQKATVRNKIRRRMSDVIEKEIKNIKEGIDIILTAMPGMEKKDFFDIKEMLNKILLKEKIYV